MLLGGAFMLYRGLGFGSRELSVNTDPPGAIVKVDGRDLGMTPVTKAKVATRAQRLELDLAGYETKELLLLPKDRELGLIALVPRAGGAPPASGGEDPELEALRRQDRELAAKIQKDAERLKQLKERDRPAAAHPAPADASQPAASLPAAAQAQPAPAPSPAPAPTPAPPPVTAAKPAADQGPISPPVLLRQVAPAYPNRARVSHFESTLVHRVRVRVFVDEAGKAQKATVMEGVPGPHGFDEAAVDAALKSAFSPSRQGGRAVAGNLEIIFLFQPLVR
jgi:TonB family protein